MQIRIDSDPIGPLSVLGELPDAPLAVLEGLNGIGKTLAIRLLQLCTGEIPYQLESPAWASLCEGLGPFSVVAGALVGGEEIRWEADTRDWSSVASDDLPIFRKITIDGRESSTADVRRLVVVHRVGGDEGIVETLAQQAGAARESVRQWSRRHTAADGSPLAVLEALTADTLHTLGDWTSLEFAEAQRVADEADVVRRERATEAASAIKRRDALAHLADLRGQVAELQSRRPGLARDAKRVDERISELQKERDQLQSQILALAGRVAGTEAVQRELQNARRTLDRNHAKLSVELSSVVVVAAELGIERTAAAAAAIADELRKRIEELLAEHAELDTAPAMRELLDEIAGDLTDAVTHGLGDQVAIDDVETETQLTVAQARAGVLTRRAELEGQPPPPQARAVREELDDAQYRLERAQQALATLTEADRLQRLVRENEARVDRAMQAYDPEAVSELQRLESERRDREQQLLSLATERAGLRQQLGALGGSIPAEQLESEIAAEAERLDVSLDELDAELELSDVDVAESQAHLTATEQALLTARREVARAVADVSRVTTALATHPEWSWLREAVPARAVPDPGTAPAQQLLALDLLRGRLDATTERLGKHRTQLAAIEGSLQGVARHLRGEDVESSEYTAELRLWLGERFSEWFNDPRVRAELLPEASSAVRVDVEQREVQWMKGDTPRSRPLEAFSSGEQAFAYTRARLAVLDEEDPRPPNRLIVLDEFGAFIAHDRLAGLLEYLRAREGEHEGDQLLVILPLARDYSEMSQNAVGAEAKRLSRLAAEIKSKKFAVQVLSS